jgi:hypothetical protein
VANGREEINRRRKGSIGEERENLANPLACSSVQDESDDEAIETDDLYEREEEKEETGGQ